MLRFTVVRSRCGATILGIGLEFEGVIEWIPLVWKPKRPPLASCIRGLLGPFRFGSVPGGTMNVIAGVCGAAAISESFEFEVLAV